MLSRRTILKWLGMVSLAPALPAVAYETRLPGASLVPPPVRSRKAWQTILEPDGSSSWVNVDGKRYLDAWLETGEADEWGKGIDDLKAEIEADKEALKWRSRSGQCFNEEDYAILRKELLKHRGISCESKGPMDAKGIPTDVDGKLVSEIVPLTHPTMNKMLQHPLNTSYAGVRPW